MPVHTRPSSRILVIDQNHRILLFRFVLANGALEGREWWATPGGALEDNETFAKAARRELFEETGFFSDINDPHVAEKEFMLQMPNGEQVLAKERFFVVRVKDQAISKLNWTDEEQRFMKDYKWWSVDELMTTKEVVFPEDILAILESTCM
ncbi:MAG: NUDIX domain-containing protein [Herminiimonas sp.]|nr:NUDIX domain-containing protein [Herminiimonas sp.]